MRQGVPARNRPPGPWVLLLETPFLSQTGTEEVRAYVQSKYNLALLALGSYIKAHSALEVRLINMVREKMTAAALLRQLEAHPPAVIGISLYSYNLATTYEIITRIKKKFPDTHICVGGPHVGIFPKETVRLDWIDTIVLGDGERPFLDICRQVVARGALAPDAVPPGTYTRESFKDAGAVTPYFLKDLDALPVPDLSLLGGVGRYRDFLSDKSMGLLTSSRGCPFVCHYCLSEKSKYRRFSVERVVEIMRRYRDQGVEYIEFWDETFNAGTPRLEQFADALLAADLGLTWAVRGAVVNHVPYETLLKLKKTGLRLIQFGVETTSPRLLSYLNKRIDLEKITAAFEVCRRAGIRTVANLMINIPGQRRAELLEDLARIKRIKPTYLSISIYNWAPGTTHYETALQRNILPGDFWRDYAARPVGAEPLMHARTEIPIEEVYRLRTRFLARYYFSVSYLYNYLKLIEFSEIRQAIGIAVMILKATVKDWLRPFTGNKNSPEDR